MNTIVDGRQFEALAHPHRDALFRAALKMCGGDAGTAEDMVQSTYLKAFVNFHRFKPGTNLRAWLFRILANNVISAFRHRRIAREAPYPSGFEPRVSTRPVVPFDFEEVGDDLKHALDGLPENYREVFLLAALDDTTYGEIARRLGVPIGTVMSRLWRARRQLKRSLEMRATAALN